MLKINRKFEYAFVALTYMNGKNPGQLTTAKEICDKYKTPFDPTARVLQIMAQNNILKALQGAKGGYLLIRDISKISLKELSDMIVGPLEIANCIQGAHSECTHSDNCLIIAPMLVLNKKLERFFETIMITDLINNKNSTSFFAHGAMQ